LFKQKDEVVILLIIFVLNSLLLNALLSFFLPFLTQDCIVGNKAIKQPQSQLFDYINRKENHFKFHNIELNSINQFGVVQMQ
jgi:hypothetical protein